MKPIFKLEFVDNVIPQNRINHEYINLVVKKWFETARSEESNRAYRLIYPKGSSKQLMFHKSGALEGLNTTALVSNGKIEAHAGLEEILVKNEYKLLSFALFGLIENYLTNIDLSIRSILEIKQMEIKAKFERVSYVLESTLDILPELLVDKTLQASYLNQIVDSNSNCYEMYVLFREQFKARCEEAGDKTRGDNSPYQDRNRLYTLKTLQKDNAFVALERFAFGKVCEIFLSNNFTPGYIESVQKQLASMGNELIDILQTATPFEERYRGNWQHYIDNEDLTKIDRERREQDLMDYIKQYDDQIESLSLTITQKVEGIQTLSRYTEETDINLVLSNGELYIEQ